MFFFQEFSSRNRSLLYYVDTTSQSFEHTTHINSALSNTRQFGQNLVTSLIKQYQKRHQHSALPQYPVVGVYCCGDRDGDPTRCGGDARCPARAQRAIKQGAAGSPDLQHGGTTGGNSMDEVL